MLSPEERWGKLFIAVQTSNVFPDGKTFVDCSPKHTTEAILAAYQQEKDEPQFDLRTFVLWDGDAVDLIFGWWTPDDTVLMPGQYGVILDNEYDYAYDIPADAIMLTTGDSTLGSGLATDDQVFLFEPDGATLIDSFSYPANPGNGVSLEKVDLLGGDLLSNWAPCECTGSISPGAGNCFCA